MTNKRYTEEFKVEAVKQITERGHSAADVAMNPSHFTWGTSCKTRNASPPPPISCPPLIAALLLTIVLQMAVLYVPVINPVFKIEALSLGELALCLVLAVIVFIAVEIEKFMIRRRQQHPTKAPEQQTPAELAGSGLIFAPQA